MKKVFALALAVAMVMSMAAVSFAAPSPTPNVDGVTGMGKTGYTYSADADSMTNKKLVQYGKAAYFPLYTADTTLVSEFDYVEGMKVKVTYEMGKDLVVENGVSIVKKAVSQATAMDISNNETLDSGYYYFLEMKTVKKETTSDADIIGTFELNKSKKGDDKDLNLKVKDLEVDFAVNVSYENNYNNSQDILVDDKDSVGEGVLRPETYYLLKYSYDEEVEFTFGKEPNEGTFTVDVSGQGKNLIWFDTIIDEEIAAANPTATKLFALNFNDVKFNRTGEFLYEGEDFEYAYEKMADGSLKLLGEFSGDEVTFKTRVLGKYLFSDTELVAAPKAAVDAPVQVTPVENPKTGAAC